MKQFQKIFNKNPVVLTFHLNWKMYQNFQLTQFQHIVNMFKINGINLELLPIITNNQSDFDKRVDQFKKGIEKICDKYDRKANVIGYSFAGLTPKAFINSHDGHNFIKTLITVGTPHK